MKIAHVVTYISADGAFGGPVSVAMGQAEELASRGHEVTLVAGWDGQAQVDVPGVEMRLFPVRRYGSGFSGTISFPLLRFFRLRASAFDVVHIHAARDLITLPTAFWAQRKGTPTFLQTHGMVTPDGRLSVKLLDHLVTRRVLRDSATAFALTSVEARGLQIVAGKGSLRTIRIANGVKAGPDKTRPTPSVPPLILFLSRLHPRKRVITFAEAARILIRRGLDLQFRVIGPDEGDRTALEEFIAVHGLAASLAYAGAIQSGEAPAHLALASIYVLPSRGEVFPMTVLEAMAVGTPVVLSEDCGIAPELRERGAAIITDGSAAEVADAIQALLDDPGRQASVTAAAHEAIRDLFSVEKVVDELEKAYERETQ